MYGLVLMATFLSTLPARGATDLFIDVFFYALFLSTLPARGATKVNAGKPTQVVLFLSTLPARGAT